jgi:hypothetical protein
LIFSGFRELYAPIDMFVKWETCKRGTFAEEVPESATWAHYECTGQRTKDARKRQFCAIGKFDRREGVEPMSGVEPLTY